MSKKCFHLALFYHRWFEDAVLHPSRNLGCLRSTIGRVAHLPRGKREEKRLGLGMVYGNHTIKVLSSGELSRKRKTFRSPAKSDMTGPDSTPLPPRARGGSTCTTHWHTVLRSSYLLPQMPTYPFLAPRGLKYRAIQSSDPARNL